MPNNQVAVETLRREAWHFGRTVRNQLLADYKREYGTRAPAPALIGAELVTDFLGARLSYDALPLNVLAETRWDAGQPLVSLNSRTHEIEGVKDPIGVTNVGVWHEISHVLRDLSMMRVGDQGTLEGMVPNLSISCPRDRPRYTRQGEEFRREFFAEEAGRAAAVSYPALRETVAFRDFIYLADQRLASSSRGWGLLYEAAAAIGVNISALIKQLEAEGFLTVHRSEGRSTLYVQPGLGDLLSAAKSG